jgi:hypothetical protein
LSATIKIRETINKEPKEKELLEEEVKLWSTMEGEGMLTEREGK